MLFAAFNGAAFCHMFCTAPETKGKTLEEMDDVFDAGRPAWRTAPKGSRLDVLRIEIEKGARTVDAPGLATAMARVPTGGEGEGEKGEEEKGREIRVLEIV